jgi:hypothetical protein
MHLTGKNRQKGFGATAALFMIALVVGIGAAVIYANRDSAGNASRETTKAYVGVFLKQAGDMRSHYTRFVSGGGDPTVFMEQWAGQVNPPHPSLALWGSTAWRLNHYGINMPGIGTTAGDKILWVEQLTDNACVAINTTLHGAGFSTTASIPTADLWTMFMDAEGQTVTPGISGWDIGCMKMADTLNVFFAVLEEA